MTTRKNEIDEELQAQAPPPEEADAVEADVVPLEEAAPEPSQITMMTAVQFIQQAQSPQMSRLIDVMLDASKERTGATWKQMLRGFALVARSMAVSMPWDEDEGMDAKRFHIESKLALPSWRECIGALLGLEFSKPEDPDEVDVQGVEVEVEEADDAPSE